MKRPKIILKNRPKIILRVNGAILKSVADLPKPAVFFDNHRKVFLLVSEEKHANRYLYLGDNGVEVIELKHGHPIRDEKGYLPNETAYVSDLIEYEYDPKKAYACFYNTLLPKSPEAIRELCRLLGKTVPEVSLEEAEKREAKLEILKKAREVRSYLRKEKAA